MNFNVYIFPARKCETLTPIIILGGKKDSGRRQKNVFLQNTLKKIYLKRNYSMESEYFLDSTIKYHRNYFFSLEVQ